MSLVDDVATVSSASIILPAAAAVIRRKNVTGYHRYFALLMVVTFFIELYAVTAALMRQNNMLVMHIYVMIEFFLLSMFYASFFKSGWQSIVIKTAIPFFLLFIIGYVFILHNPAEYHPVVRAIPSGIFTIYSLTAFYRMLQSVEESRLESRPDFWLNAGVLIYFSGNIFVFSFYLYLPGLDLNDHTLWYLHSILNILGNILYMIGMLCLKKKIS